MNEREEEIDRGLAYGLSIVVKYVTGVERWSILANISLNLNFFSVLSLFFSVSKFTSTN